MILLLGIALGYWLGRNFRLTRRRKSARRPEWRDTNVNSLEEEL